MGYAAQNISFPERAMAARVPPSLKLVANRACPSTLSKPDCTLKPRGASASVLRLAACGGTVSDQSNFKKDMIALLPRLLRFARTLTRSQADADDLVQEACLKAIANQDQWDPSQDLDRWMFRIARNLWFSELRKRKVRVGTGQVDAEEANELQVDSQGEAQVFASEIRASVSALPSELSSALMLVCSEGYSYREAAEMLEIPIGTVMSRIHRARKILSEGLSSMKQVTS